MKNLKLIAFALILISRSAFAYDPVFTVDNPESLGNIPVIYDGGGIPSTMTRWKSIRVQATTNGRATHFIIRVGSSNIGSVPVGFAVYAGTSGERDPIGTLLIRGYYDSFNFGNDGYYASFGLSFNPWR